MAVLGRLLVGSGERLDLTDLLSIDSYSAADFKYFVKSLIGGTKPYILYGFDVINPQDSIGTENISLRVAESVVYYPASGAGSFYYGLEEGNPNALPLVPELRKNATNFVYLSFSTFDAARDSRAFWDPDQNGGDGGEFSQDVNTETALKVEVNVSVSTFPENTIPICKVIVGTSVIESIQDCRDQMFRLGTGGVSPNPFSTYDFREDPSAPYARTEPPTTMTSALNPNPFQGGDKNIRTLKEWMDVVMTRIKELGGTTYWYEGSGVPGAGPNINNVFLDALASTVKSKGEWQHSAVTPGLATWTEDIHYYSLIDSRDLIIRANAITLSSDDTVAWINLRREAAFNGSATAVDWQNGSNAVNGATGAFANLSKGDWVKKNSDPINFFLRIDEFYALPNLAGGSTTPALAQSIRLNANYAGSTGTEVGNYTKGEYLLADINITDRDDPAIQAAGGNFFWLTFRSDTALSLGSAVATSLSVDITEADGERARVDATAHGLVDGDHISITTGPYLGTYLVEVENADTFFINTTVTGDSLAQSAFYAIVTTAARSTAFSYSLETANHGFKSGEKVIIGSTASAFDGSYTVNTRSATTFQIPMTSAPVSIGPIAGEIVRLVRLNVRTEFGTVKVVQGESTNIGDLDSKNLLSYIGMKSLAQTKPDYLVPTGYNALNGHQNYNSSPDDDLTVRVSKLTAMMADRVQDRGMQIVGRTNIINRTNGINQELSALSNLTLKKPSAPDQTIDLTTLVSIPANSVAVLDIDRDGSTAITPSVESWGSAMLIGENKIILFYRFAGTTVYDWKGNAIEASGHINTEYPEDSSNRNVFVWNTGVTRLSPSTGLVTLDVQEAFEVTDVTVTAGAIVPQSSWFEFYAALDAVEYYAWYNVDGGGVDPAVVGKTGIMVAISSADSADDVALATATAINGGAGADVTAVNTLAVVRITNDLVGDCSDAADGAVATNFQIEIITHGEDPDIEIVIPGSTDKNIIDVDAINTLGTLVLADGQSAWVRINRFAFKTFNTISLTDTPDTDGAGAIYITNTADVPIDQDVLVLYTRILDNLLETHKAEHPDGNVYDETLVVVAGLPVDSYEIQGPVAFDTELQLPPDSRDPTNSLQQYIVGSGQLELFLNGQYLRTGIDWEEVGANGSLSRRIKIKQELPVDDDLTFRIDAKGAVYFASDGGGGGGTLQDAYDGGRFISVVVGQPIVITGASGKLMSIQGDLEVTGVIDPQGITFSLEASDPLGATDNGLWVNATQQLIFKRGASAALNISTDLLRRDGTLAMTAALDMGGFKISNLGAPTLAGDAINKTYADAISSGVAANFLKLDGTNAMAADLDFGGFKGVNAADPVADQDLATKIYVDNNKNKVVTLYTNNTGVTILAGSVVIASQASSNEIELADASSIATSEGVVGVVIDDILDGAEGYVQVAGVVTVLGALTIGKLVYLSTTISQATTTPPSATGESLVILGTAVSNSEVELHVQFVKTIDNAYAERYDIVSGAPADDYELTGPILGGTNITLPPDSRNAGASRSYLVGEGIIHLYLNGEKLEVGDDWLEVGGPGNPSTQVSLIDDLVVGDKLSFVIPLTGETVIGSGGGGGGEANTASNQGGGAGVFKQKVGVDLQLRSIEAISGLSATQALNTIQLAAKLNNRTFATTDTALLTDDFIKVDATGGAVTVNLPAAASAPGKVYYIKKIDASSNNMIIDPDGGELIDNVSDITSNTQYQSYTVVSDGTAWWIL